MKFYVLLILFSLTACCSQKKINYNGQKIHPLSLEKFLPTLSSSQGKKYVNLTQEIHPEQIQLVNEIGVANKGNWYRAYSSNSSFTDYTFIGCSAKKSFVVLTRQVDNTLSRSYVLFLIKKNNILRSVGLEEAKNIKYNVVSVNKDYLQVDNQRVPIIEIIEDVNKKGK